MRKIINGRKYDTDTAQELGYYSNYGSWNDSNHFEETLFRKKNGEFFLYGEGGPTTKYREPEGQNGWTGGSRITPLSVDRARDWAEKHLDADEYESIFGKVDEGETPGKISVTLCVSEERWETAKRAAAEKGIEISEYIESLISSSTCTLYYWDNKQEAGE